MQTTLIRLFLPFFNHLLVLALWLPVVLNSPIAQSQTVDNAKQAVAVPNNGASDIEDIQQTFESLLLVYEANKEKDGLNSEDIEKFRDAHAVLEKGLTKQLKEELLRNIRANTADLDAQKSLIEDNSIRLYEILLQLSGVADETAQLTQELKQTKQSDYISGVESKVTANSNRLWVMLAIIMVFFTPLAFSLSGKRDYRLVDGIQQYQGVLLMCLGVFLAYSLVGFGVMYGDSKSGIMGITNPIMGMASSSDKEPAIPFNQFVLYKTGFVMLAAMVVYMVVGRLISSTSHLFLALLVGALLVPVAGHWAWSGYFIPGNKGWLESSGFIDQSGAVPIHLVAAWFAFWIAWKLGRSFTPTRMSEDEASDPVYTSSAALLLWISWLGYTTGTLSISSEEITTVILNVSLAGAAGGMTAYLHYTFFYSDKSRAGQAVGGFISGLVAIAACAQSVTLVEALVIGSMAGLFKNMAHAFLRKAFFKQSWQARSADLVAIHGVASIWGSLCVAIFGTKNTFSYIDMAQLAIQAQGILATLAYSIIMANIALFLLGLDLKRLFKKVKTR